MKNPITSLFSWVCGIFNSKKPHSNPDHPVGFKDGGEWNLEVGNSFGKEKPDFMISVLYDEDSNEFRGAYIQYRRGTIESSVACPGGIKCEYDKSGILGISVPETCSPEDLPKVLEVENAYVVEAGLRCLANCWENIGENIQKYGEK